MLGKMIAATGLAILWLVMSGLWDKSLILAFGAISVLFTMYLFNRMEAADGEKLLFTINPIKTAGYWFWLMVEIAKSNWAVTKVILSGKVPDNQKMLLTPATQKCDMAKVIYANSITLTPGTITVETEGDQFLVHALDFAKGDRDGLEDMDRRVSAIETDNAGAKS